MLGCALAAVALAACGEATVGSGANAPKPAAKPDPPGTTAGDAVATSPAKGGHSGVAKEVADPLEADSYPAPASVKHASAATPVKAGAAIVAAGAPSNAEVRKELEQMQAVERSARQSQHLRLTPVPGGESIGGNGTIPIPTNVPEVVQKVIAGANEIADFPYVYGGGHASFVDNAYDCSGSVSYALAAAGLVTSPMVSGDFEDWGDPGPGRWVTIYANAGHVWMEVAGWRFDTVALAEDGTRWAQGGGEFSGFVVRHPPGL